MTTMEVEPDIPAAGPRPLRSFAVLRAQRTLQIILGLFWLLDAALQYQPYMFGKGFTNSFILANASGQPEPVTWLINTAGHFISPDVAVWNTFFATIQVVIAVGLFYRPTVRPALVISMAWAFGVWFFGEGMGMVLTGTASALSGAPGSVTVYGLLAVMAWPGRTRQGESIEKDGGVGGVASSAAAQGIGGVVTPLAVWSGYWVLAAVLFLLPANRTRTGVSSMITGMAPGTPEWYSHFLTSFGNAFSTIGTQTSWVLAIAALVIGIGPLVAKRVEIFLLVGALLSFLLWITGQGFLGGVLSGTGTDPNSSPLIIVLAFAMVPTVVAVGAEWRSPLMALRQSRPYLVAGGATATVCALILVATYPVAAQASSSSSMSGMSGMSGSSGSSSMVMPSTGTQTASTAKCTTGNGGTARTGLNVTNSPNMVMAGPGTDMDMNGADASAAAGLNATKLGWSYTGPALPSTFTKPLLADGNNGSADLHMADNGCAKEPTFSEQIGATQYVQATTQAVAPYATPAAALAAGYVAVSPTSYPVVYYVNPTIVAANATAKRTLSAQHVDGLMYAATPSGQEVLAAAMYILPSTVTKAPMPYGALVQWHERTDVCGPSTESATSPLQITGIIPCTSGNVQQATPYLTMVWQVPVAGGPLAIQPPDIQIVEAAVMASAT